MTIQQMAKMAIDVQTACNLSGIVRSFHEVTQAMRIEHGMSTPECNRHPITLMFIDKLVDLSGHDSGNTAQDAYRECERLASAEFGTRG